MSNSPRLNFVWISLEDCSPRFGCYGDALARTPNLDQLANEGARYSRAFSTAAVCAPARCAIITGMYAASLGAQHMRCHERSESGALDVPPYECVPPPHVKCFTEYLRMAGYYCTNNEKTDYQFSPPFTAWDELGAKAHWRGRSSDQPFFAVFNPMMSHESGMWPRKDSTILTNPDSVTVPPYLVDSIETRKAIARYYDRIAEGDAVAGRVLQQLEEDGLAQDTVVMVWSDHGGGLPRQKRWPYEAGMRVPLIVRWPEQISPGTVCDQLISTIDLPPTMLSLAGVTIPTHFQGHAFLGKEQIERQTVVGTRDRHDQAYDCVRSIRDDRWRYVRNYYPQESRAIWNPYLNRHPAMQDLWSRYATGELTEAESFCFANRDAEELYDLNHDPDEIRNLANHPDHREKLIKLRAQLDEWQRQVGDRYAEPEYQIADRFWPGGRQPETARPRWIVYHADHPQGTPYDAPLRLNSPGALQLFCPTQGASLGYRFVTDPPERWRIYSQPLVLPPGTHEIEGRATRIGFKESPKISAKITIIELEPFK